MELCGGRTKERQRSDHQNGAGHGGGESGGRDVRRGWSRSRHQTGKCLNIPVVHIDIEPGQSKVSRQEELTNILKERHAAHFHKALPQYRSLGTSLVRTDSSSDMHGGRVLAGGTAWKRVLAGAWVRVLAGGTAWRRVLAGAW